MEVRTPSNNSHDLPMQFALMLWCVIATVLVSAAVGVQGLMAARMGIAGQAAYGAMLLITAAQGWVFMRLFRASGMDRLSALSVLGAVFVALWVLTVAGDAVDRLSLLLLAPLLMCMAPFSQRQLVGRRIFYLAVLLALVGGGLWVAQDAPGNALTFHEKTELLSQMAVYCYMAYLPFIALAIYIWRRFYYMPVVGYTFLLLLAGAACFLIGDGSQRWQYLFWAPAFLFSASLYVCLILLTGGIQRKALRYGCFMLACWQGYALLHNTYISVAMVQAKYLAASLPILQ